MAVASVPGRPPWAEISSSHANAIRPAPPASSPGARDRGAARGAHARSDQPTERPTARQGLKARKTSPKSTLTGTSPSQNAT